MLFLLLRFNQLERSMDKENLSDEDKLTSRSLFAKKETEFLRLKRARIGREDFESLQVECYCM